MTSDRKRFRPLGPYAAILIPFEQDGRLDVDGLKKQIDFLVDSGISGIFPCGTSGEFVNLSIVENCEIMDVVSQGASGRMDVLPGACASSIDGTLRLIKNAEKNNCPAVVVCPPYYYTLNQREVLSYYKEIIKKTDINIILYNIPAFTNEISMDTFKELIMEDKVVGIKDSSGNMKKIIHYVQAADELRPDFAVMTGTDDILVPALIGGCTGSMTALSGIIPEVTTQIYRSFYERDFDKAVKLQKSILRLLELAESILFPAGYKLVMEERGFKMGHLKQVIPEMKNGEYLEIRKLIKNELTKILRDKVVPTCVQGGER
ncbi:MAG: dihydrodipicolinate synthase family protein [Clostridiales bacterium]|nr:dihydrodipicolinate synthase family protein [Clostridiales bacterium]HBM80548.1 hypothetical protein [Clostridiaceae bacterium]